MVAVTDKTIYRIAFCLSSAVDVDVSKHITSFTQWRHKRKRHSANTVKDMNKKKKHKDWNETSYALHPFFFEGLHYLYSYLTRSWSMKMRSAYDMHGKEQKCIMSLV